MSRKFVLFLSVFGMMLAGCANMIPTPVPTSTPPPPPEPVEGVDYIEGEAEVPEGKYLLVEFKVEINMCLSETMHIDFPFYEYEDGMLSGSASLPKGYDPDDPIIGYLGEYTSGGTGVMGIASSLEAVQSLPHQHRYLSITILSIDSDGSMVAEVEGTVLELEPDESWSYRTIGKTCDWLGNETYDHHFINQGFLTEDQIDLKGY